MAVETQQYQANVHTVSPLNDKMFHVVLEFDEASPNFDAGQYLLLHLDIDGQSHQLPYSIANAPACLTGKNKHQLELYIANTGELSQQVIAQLRALNRLQIEMPMGDCIITGDWLVAHQNQPLIMVASGSGFSQIKSLSEAVFALAPEQEVHIYWSNRIVEDFYLSELNQRWEKTHPNCHYHPILESGSQEWTGKSGLIYEVIQRDFSNLSDAQLFACGSPNMVYQVLDELAGLGVSQENMHSDVFAYAPR